MLKDIPVRKVEDFAIAIVPREGAEEEELWDTFVLNLREEPIRDVLINSRGYGELEGESRKTTVLRHFFEEIGPSTAALLEPIQTSLFTFTNEFWVSFSYDGHMFDKKYIFVRGSIDAMNFTRIPLLNRPGVMIL